LKLTGIVEADLILTAERAHRAAIVQAFPLARPYTFTLRQATEIARGLASGPLPTTVPLPSTSDPAARLRWFIDELDAGRGPSMGVDTDDIPDPHKVRENLHATAIDLIDQTVSDFATAIGYVLEMP
jgi:protein-tyrosine phosphatase